MGMPSVVWSGHLHFGLVVMPVRLLVAARTTTTRFRRLYRKPINKSTDVTSFPSFSHDLENHDSDLTEEVADTQSRPEDMNGQHTAEHQYSAVRQVFQSQLTGEEIRPEEMVKGYEIAPNEFAAINPQEIKAAEIETSDTIDLFHFVKATKVDPIYFERSYYVAPDSGAEKGYALLLETMRKEESLGIARIGMHRREHMLILRPSEDYLVAYTMFYANEVRPAPRLELTTEFSNKELSMATALIKGYEGDFDPKQFKDLYQERISKIIEEHVDNRTEVHSAPISQTSGAPDLVEQLRLSLAQIKSKPDAAPSKKSPRKTPTVARKKPQRVRA
jgi:DNA end-binding protein Ku